MNKFDKIIMEGMVNTLSMLKARTKVMSSKQSAGFDVKAELVRSKRFVLRYESFLHDWSYWYYDERGEDGEQRGAANPPALPGIWDGVEVRIEHKYPKLVLPQAREIELVLDTNDEKS